jgi:hypothetical protein
MHEFADTERTHVDCMLTPAVVARADCAWVLSHLALLQIEFGAHQVILVRSTSEEGLKVLPEKVRLSNALKLEVLQSKVIGKDC